MTGYAAEPTPSPREASADNTELSLRTIIEAIRRRWWVVGIVFVVVTGLGTWRTVRKTNEYQATASVRVAQQSSPISGMSTGQGVQDYRIDRLVAEQEVIRTREVATRVAQALGLRVQLVNPGPYRWDVFGRFRPVVDSAAAVQGAYILTLEPDAFAISTVTREELGRAPYGDTVTFHGTAISIPVRPALEGRVIPFRVISLSDAAGTVAGSVGTALREKTDIINISARTPDRLLSVDIANEMVTQYRAFAMEEMKNKALERSNFIREQAELQRKVLAAAQADYQKFLKDSNVTNVSEEQAALAGKIFDLQSQRDAFRLERQAYLAVASEINKPLNPDTSTQTLRRAVGAGQVESNPTVQHLYTQWLTQTTRLQELQARPFNRLVYEIEAQEKAIDSTKKQLTTALDDYFRQLDRKISAADSAIAQRREEIKRFPGLSGQIATLYDRVSSAKTVSDNLTGLLFSAQIAARGEMDVVRPIDPATMPLGQVSPDRRKDAMLAAALGLLLGIAAAVGLDRLDDSVRTPNEIEALGISVLGMIPAIKMDEIQAEGSAAMERLVTHANPRSPVAEAYRSLRTNLAFARVREEIKALVLTSPGPADGKSTTVANLAITFAQQGQRTLLIDADLRRAVLDKTFSVPKSPGLTDVIVGTAELEQAANATDIPNLFVMGSGQFPPNPSELLGSEAMRNVLRDARAQFDVVLFDSPPLLAVTDAAVLSTMVDGTVLVVRMGATARPAVRRALEQLQAVRGRVLGAVMNDVDLKRGSYYGGYGYAYYAYYGNEANGNGHKSGVLNRLRGIASGAKRGG